jgi:hypothetical protein
MAKAHTLLKEVQDNHNHSECQKDLIALKKEKYFIQNLIFIQLYRRNNIFKASFDGLKNVLNRRILLRGSKGKK